MSIAMADLIKVQSLEEVKAKILARAAVQGVGEGKRKAEESRAPSL